MLSSLVMRMMQAAAHAGKRRRDPRPETPLPATLPAGGLGRNEEQSGERYLARARDILSPDQVGAYEKFLASRREMQNAAMKMAAQMFAPK